ncbi:uncharacterized protein LOC111402678 [Olea europaea var. sylvestris]|uniref:uncharacterized protein LOC111402678 n=1 Tax=Olea europaea var. sylvestris TaxID=158386 RepID=UPI000C1D79F6|nr:uncharacterized protein LOC111402678 [Olea europaea var. sylvestris]
MRFHLRMMISLVLALVLILQSHLHEAQGARLMTETKASSKSIDSSTQAFRSLHPDEKNPFKKVKSSFRKVPPSRSNPTQNKFKPP